MERVLLIPIDRAWVEEREAILIAEEDGIIRAARDQATGADRAFMDTLIAERESNIARRRSRTV
jgi:hypothetical protein